MTPFEWILLVCIFIIALSLLSGLVLILVARDRLTRAVLSDLVFYSMVLIYLIWTIPNDTMIDYEVAILAALVAGVLPTLSMSRIISRGRR
ncbi:cation:proton antiporter [Corynebacterium guangdongense]|uniref:Multicomponent Na+:H+ antiporter subunit F n=1 Tax=Corynebacterium guangdongense TaxID=1783348 RepID=A0ABU2A0T7_9CORY|nr:cation:proton antiporter [Corynebacterium guangdongense]MDR7330795.1 multicomponent Na+:H+ antiporter subunit F [Corynebacterium guangdongense]WJZ16810.1 putative monovalent cation/H+ antiporter subunit F [Corynebacterium guangdongense]